MSIKTAVKRVAYTVAPRLAVAVQASRARRRSHRLVKEWGLWDLNQRLAAELGTQVLDGPFAGMTLSALSRAEHIGPYLLGTYEAELHDTWNRLLQRKYNEFVDVGANFGYYAVGLARRFPSTNVVAFDVDGWARKAVAEMCAANDTPNVSIETWCDPAWLALHLKDRSLVISDCEGYEGALFCEQWVPAFATCTFVIELHEAFVPGVTGQCRAMFADTHAAHMVDTRGDMPLKVRSASLTDEEMLRVSTEPRGPQQWLVLTPLASAAGK
ncbi:MAG: hypothetical protein ABIS29_08225 [Vicinamibacterales bacterium]